MCLDFDVLRAKLSDNSAGFKTAENNVKEETETP